MQTTRRQIVSNATPFIARNSPRKLTSTQIAQISGLVKNPQMMNPNPSGMNPNPWGRREANTHTWLVTSSPSEEELEDWSLQETMAERRKAASRQWRRRRWSGSRERRARVMNWLVWFEHRPVRPLKRARRNGRLSPSNGVRQHAPRQPDRRDPPVGFAVFWAKTQRQCSALQISPIVGGFLCPASNVVPICYPSP